MPDIIEITVPASPATLEIATPGVQGPQGETGATGAAGEGFEAEATAALANNQSSFANVSGMLAAWKSQLVHFYIERVTTGGGATDLKGSGLALITEITGSYVMSIIASDVDCGVELDIDTATGNVQYKTSNITGTPSVSKINWRFIPLAG